MSNEIQYILAMVLSFVPALVFHEAAHGFAAYKLGDPTAKRAGRLSLNPLKHIDPFGTVILPALLMFMHMPMFGYAKPVPYNPRYFKDPRKGDLITGLAGPAANLLLAFLGAGIAWALLGTALTGAIRNPVFEWFYLMYLPLFTLVNLFLMFFNLLPIPPLDGSSIFAILIPPKYLPKYYEIQRYAFPIFMMAIILLPYMFHINPFGWYFDVTAYNVMDLIYPFSVY